MNRRAALRAVDMSTTSSAMQRYFACYASQPRPAVRRTPTVSLATCRSDGSAEVDLCDCVDAGGLPDAVVDHDPRFRVGFEHAAIGMSLRGIDGRYVHVNRALCSILGRPAGEIVGRRPEDFTHPEDLSASPARRMLEVDADTGEAEKRYIRPDGVTVWVHVTVAVVRDASGRPEYFFSQVQDVSLRRAVEADLRHRALHDRLTDLPNRSLIRERLEGALSRAELSKSSTAVLVVDIDQFKLVNDTRGHLAGDMILVEMSRRLLGGMRSSETVGRFGGDEFVIIAEGIADTSAAMNIAERVAELMETPFTLDSSEHYLTVSIGIAVGQGGSQAPVLLSHADAALHKAKDRGRARAEIYDAEMQHEAARRLELRTSLRRSISNGELRFAYQPVVAMRDGRLLGLEALCRWEHPTLGAVPPDQFIPVAEESGLVGCLGQAVVRDALGAVSRWRRELPGGGDLWVAVNLSALQLQDPRLWEQIADALDSTDVSPAALHLEITETVLLDQPEVCVANLVAMRELGIRVSLDDFGTGYASLAYLKRYPIDSIKIDRSLVSGVGEDPRDTSIVAAVIELGHVCGLDVVAEGVESPAQLAALRRLGCDEGQGFFWSAALDPTEVVPWAISNVGMREDQVVSPDALALAHRGIARARTGTRTDRATPSPGAMGW